MRIIYVQIKRVVTVAEKLIFKSVHNGVVQLFLRGYITVLRIAAVIGKFRRVGIAVVRRRQIYDGFYWGSHLIGRSRDVIFSYTPVAA